MNLAEAKTEDFCEIYYKSFGLNFSISFLQFAQNYSYEKEISFQAHGSKELSVLRRFGQLNIYSKY